MSAPRATKTHTEGELTVTEDGKRTYLFIFNDSPYGDERPYNALRLAMNLAKLPDTHVAAADQVLVF